MPIRLEHLLFPKPQVRGGLALNAYVAQLFVNIPGGYDLSAKEVPSLAIAGQGSLAIEGDTLYVTSGTVAVTIDLHGLSVSQVAAQLPTGMTGTVLQNGIAELLALPASASFATVPCTLTIAQNPIWLLIGMLARSKESRKRSRDSQVAQMNLNAATGGILNWWGGVCNLERYQGEPDLLYAHRMINTRFRPNVNNVAIEKTLGAMGYQTSVVDTTPANFTVNVTLPTTPPVGYYYSVAQLADAVTLLKAAGTRFVVSLQGSLADNVGVSDSISNTLNQASWTVGDSLVIGQFTV